MFNINYHAAFVVALSQSGLWAATTRPKDRGEAGSIGLPGGKLDPGETASEAAWREAKEEGWDIDPTSMSFLVHQYIDNNPVAYFLVRNPAIIRKDWKEKGRVNPIEASYEEIVDSGKGNHLAVMKAEEYLRPCDCCGRPIQKHNGFHW